MVISLENSEINFEGFDMLTKKVVVKSCCLTVALIAAVTCLFPREARADYVQYGVTTFSEWGDPITLNVPDQQGNRQKSVPPVTVEVGATGSSSGSFSGAQQSLSAGVDATANSSYARARVAESDNYIQAVWVWQGQGNPSPFTAIAPAASVDINANITLGVAGGSTLIEGGNNISLTAYDAFGEAAGEIWGEPYGQSDIFLGDTRFDGVPVNQSDLRSGPSKTLSATVAGSWKPSAAVDIQLSLSANCGAPSGTASATQNASVGTLTGG